MGSVGDGPGGSAAEPWSDIIDAARRMDQCGWVPSVSGNLSARLGDGTVAITRSGRRKGALTRDDIIRVTSEGRAVLPGDVPSAETPLHCQLYASFPHVGAVLHGHSIAATVLSRRVTQGIDFSGYEMIKAFEGCLTHDVTVRLAVLDNDQDMERLVRLLDERLQPDWIGYLLRGHGVYVWGRDVAHALSKLEALEFLLACELEARRLG